ncbi:hypothetical protein Leryth_011662 [Lithospermum erythrorhizon]|nr:hypothetical protein Leryth_011662 [Lithospermum erythrorhizon]
MVQDRKKMVQESGGVLPSRTEPLVPVEQPGPNFGFPTTPPQQLAYQQLQAVRFEHLRRHQMMNQTQQTRGVKNGERMPIGLPGSAWPPLQRSQQKPQPGTGMTAVFLGNNLDVAKKQCAGTGVFLPRTESSTGNLKNKPAYSPVLIPDKVIQALNLNLETLGVQNQARLRPGCFNNNGFSADHGAALKYINENKKSHVMVQQSQSIAELEPENQEVIRLPAEWTY